MEHACWMIKLYMQDNVCWIFRLVWVLYIYPYLLCFMWPKGATKFCMCFLVALYDSTCNLSPQIKPFIVQFFSNIFCENYFYTAFNTPCYIFSSVKSGRKCCNVTWINNKVSTVSITLQCFSLGTKTFRVMLTKLAAKDSLPKWNQRWNESKYNLHQVAHAKTRTCNTKQS